MKKSVCVVLFMFMFLSLSFSAFGQQVEYKKIYRLGVAPLEKNGVKTLEELEALIVKKIVVIDLLLSGRKELVEEFYRQFPEARVEEISFDKNDHVRIISMSWENWDKKPKVTVPVEWAGEGIVEAYIFKIDYMHIGKSYWFLIPKKCGNVSLWKIEDLEIPIRKIEEKPVVEYPSRSNPEIETVHNPEPKPVVETSKEKDDTDYFADLAGGIFKSCYKEYIILRAGFAKKISEKFELTFLGGIGLPLDFQTGYPGTEEWKVVFMGDTKLIYRPSSFFIGVGAGMSSAVKAGNTKQLEGICTTGISSGKIDLFVEVRLPMQKDKSFKNNYKIFAGIGVHWGR